MRLALLIGVRSSRLSLRGNGPKPLVSSCGAGNHSPTKYSGSWFRAFNQISEYEGGRERERAESLFNKDRTLPHLNFSFPPILGILSGFRKVDSSHREKKCLTYSEKNVQTSIKLYQPKENKQDDKKCHDYHENTF